MAEADRAAAGGGARPGEYAEREATGSALRAEWEAAGLTAWSQLAAAESNVRAGPEAAGSTAFEMRRREISGACAVPDDCWIDWHLGRLSPQAAANLAAHLERCERCRDSFFQWQKWLGVPGDDVSAGPSVGWRNGAGEAPEPSGYRMRAGRRRAALRGRVALRGAQRAVREYGRSRRLALGAAIMLLVVGLVALWQHPADDGRIAQVQTPQLYAQIHEPAGVALMNRADTVVYRPELFELLNGAAGGGHAGVTLWANGRTGELFLLLEGMLPSETRDVRVWASSENGDTSLGVVQFHQARGHIYRKWLEFAELGEISLTFEPKDGRAFPAFAETPWVTIPIESIKEPPPF